MLKPYLVIEKGPAEPSKKYPKIKHYITVESTTDDITRTYDLFTERPHTEDVGDIIELDVTKMNNRLVVRTS